MRDRVKGTGMSTWYVDLKAVCNAGPGTPIIPRQSGWGGFPIAAKRLDGFPAGKRVFGRVPFGVIVSKAGDGKSFLLLGPQDHEPRCVHVDAKFTTLYLLHMMDRGDLGRTPVVYTLHYADGSCAKRVITVGEDVADWLFPCAFANCLVGWTGYHKDNEFQKSVYVSEIVNPRPKDRVAAVTVQRCDRYGQYVLLGMTLSTAAPFLRKAARGAKAGLADYVHLDNDIIRLKEGKLEITATLHDASGRTVRGAKLTATVNGKRHTFCSKGHGHVLCIARQKGWRKYANAVRISARCGGRLMAERDAVFYANGYPRLLTPPHKRKPPQLIILGIDDCKSLNGLEAMLDIMEGLKAKGARAVFTMYTSPCPPRSADMQKVLILYQRLYDMGCEFANHTLNHNPGGVNWFALPPKEQVREIAGCRQWFRDNIHGLWHVYSQKSGGGGARGFRDPEFSRDLLRSQKFEYSANNVTARYETSIPHPDLQFWPYKLTDEWAIDIGLIDGNAPPVHRPITKGFFTDYSGKFDYETADGVAMMVANFEHRYSNPNRPPLIVNAFHEWGFGDYQLSHRNERAILEGFLTNVLVTNRNKYPNTYVVTFHQLIEYMRRDDIKAIIAEGSGQGR